MFCSVLPLLAGAVELGSVPSATAEEVGTDGGPAFPATVMVSGAGIVASLKAGAAAAIGEAFAAVDVHQPLTTDSA